MMKVIFTMAFLICSVVLFAQGLWIQRDSLDGPTRANAVSFVLEDDGYILTGYDGFNKKRSMVSYDPDPDDWDSELSLGGLSGDGLNRTSAIGFNLEGFGYIGLGESDGFMFSDLWKFDRYTNTWTQMADFTGGARTQAVSFVANDTAYVCSGKLNDFSTLTNDMYSYDGLTNAWTQRADFPGTPRQDAIGITMGSRGYVGLGYDGSSMPTDFYEYNAEDDTWLQKASFPGSARINSTGYGVFPQLYITTGDDGFNYLNDTWEYNYFGDVWQQVDDFPGDPRAGATSFVIEGRGYVGTGFGNGTYYDDFYEYVHFLTTAETVEIEATLYPNPAIDQFTITTSAALDNPVLKLFSADGKEVSNKSTFESSGFSTYSAYLNNFAIGNYYLVIFEKDVAVLSKPIVIIDAK